ncbi:MAG: stage II sporulation protein R, partial [Clostridiales bacterium]|nr:stage II sporulation protein R [Clostridiales bacterium]
MLKKSFILKEFRILGLSIICGLIFTTVVVFSTKVYATRTQSAIADDVIRFHVLANSDSPKDQ